jgi:hypothetical protein
MDFVAELVVLHDDLGDVSDWDPHVFVAGHGGVEIKIVDMHCHALGVLGGKNTIQQALDGG